MSSLTSTRNSASARARGASATAAPEPVSLKAQLTPMLLFVYALWFIILCDPQWFVASLGAEVARKVPTVLFGLFLVLALLRGSRQLFAPLLAFTLTTGLMVVVAYNRYYALAPAKQVLLFYVLVVGTLAFVRSARQAWPLIGIFFLWQYVWWVGWGAKSGLVPWHPTNGNYDGYGPLMTLAIPSCYYFGLAVKKRWLKWAAFGCATGAVIGLVSTFARGAAFSGAAVLLFIWVRSPRKGRTTAAIVAAVVVVFLAANVFFAGAKRGEASNSFWVEMATTFSLAEGEEEATIRDRYVLWALARRVWRENPVLGVGPGNFGPYSAEHFRVGETGGFYDENPLRLYDRALHSSYYQILSEYGLVGCAIGIWMLVDFWRRNRRLRSPPFVAQWTTLCGGAMDIRFLSYALEGSLIAYLASSTFYNQLYVHWLYTLLGMNVLLHECAMPRYATKADVQRAKA